MTMNAYAQHDVKTNTSQEVEPTLVFIHGFLDGAATWDEVVKTLGARAAHSVRVDLAGMGARADEDGPYSLDGFVADVSKRVATLNRPVILVGHSMGAQIAELTAAQLGTQVRALVLLTPVPLGGTGLPNDAMQSFHALGGNPAAQRELRRQLSANLDDGRLEKLARIGDRVKAESVGVFADIWNQGHALGAQHTLYDGPVLIVHAEQDPFVNTEMIYSRVTPHFANPSVSVVRNVGHWPHVEQPEAVAALLSAFLGTIARPAQAKVAGQGWTRAFEQKSADTFRDAFAGNIVLEASVLTRPITGIEAVRNVMAAASTIYEALTFTHEATHGLRHYLEWEAQAFGGETLYGITVLTKDENGKIVRAAIHHRPLGSALRFSAELRRRLEGNVDAGFFYDPA